MPLCFLDTFDGFTHFKDQEGIDLPDSQGVRRFAQDTLADLVRFELPDSDQRKFSVTVRNQEGVTIYVVELLLKSEWHMPH